MWHHTEVEILEAEEVGVAVLHMMGGRGGGPSQAGGIIKSRDGALPQLGKTLKLHSPPETMNTAGNHSLAEGLYMSVTSCPGGQSK